MRENIIKITLENGESVTLDELSRRNNDEDDDWRLDLELDFDDSDWE